MRAGVEGFVGGLSAGKYMAIPVRQQPRRRATWGIWWNLVRCAARGSSRARATWLPHGIGGKGGIITTDVSYVNCGDRDAERCQANRAITALVHQHVTIDWHHRRRGLLCARVTFECSRQEGSAANYFATALRTIESVQTAHITIPDGRGCHMLKRHQLRLFPGLLQVLVDLPNEIAIPLQAKPGDTVYLCRSHICDAGAQPFQRGLAGQARRQDGAASFAGGAASAASGGASARAGSASATTSATNRTVMGLRTTAS